MCGDGDASQKNIHLFYEKLLTWMDFCAIMILSTGDGNRTRRQPGDLEEDDETVMENEKMTANKFTTSCPNRPHRRAFNQHSRKIHTLYAETDGQRVLGPKRSLETLGMCWPVLLTRLLLSTRPEPARAGCNCDACMAGDDPAEWAGDGAADLVHELIANMDFIEVGYFDDERRRNLHPPSIHASSRGRAATQYPARRTGRLLASAGAAGHNEGGEGDEQR